MRYYLSNEAFNKILILFWTLWWLIAFWTDVTGGLAHLGWLHMSWAPDTNYPFLVESLKMYNVPSLVPFIFFILILAFSFLSAVSFFWASFALNQPREIWIARARTAYIISLTFWLAFFIADQLVMKFDLEENHMVQGGFELLTFFALYLLPE
jgi:hypothetical protein